MRSCRILYWLSLSNVDPSVLAMGEAFAAAAARGEAMPAMPTDMPKGVSAWPIMVFLGFIFTGPYLIMKLIGSVTTASLEECKCANRLRLVATMLHNCFKCMGVNPNSSF